MTVPENQYTERPVAGGVQRRFQFENGYGASAVCHPGSYGGDLGRWEVTVTDEDGRFIYDTPITDGVLGWLTEAERDNVVRAIAALPKKGAK